MVKIIDYYAAVGQVVGQGYLTTGASVVAAVRLRSTELPTCQWPTWFWNAAVSCRNRYSPTVCRTGILLVVCFFEPLGYQKKDKK